MMNYPSVNLLKKSEQRHQGVVSRKFTFVSAVVAPILLIAILSGVKLFQYNGVKSELTANRILWKDLEPRLTLFKDENRGLVMNRKALDLFGGWKNSQASFVTLLEDIQGIVPEQVQFTRLSVQTKKTGSVYATVDDLALSFDLVIEGLAHGARAENYVIDLRKDLLTCQQIGSTFESIKLASMRKREGAAGQSLREFRLEGKSVVEEGL